MNGSSIAAETVNSMGAVLPHTIHERIRIDDLVKADPRQWESAAAILQRLLTPSQSEALRDWLTEAILPVTEVHCKSRVVRHQIDLARHHPFALNAHALWECATAEDRAWELERDADARIRAHGMWLLLEIWRGPARSWSGIPSDLHRLHRGVATASFWFCSQRVPTPGEYLAKLGELVS